MTDSNSPILKLHVGPASDVENDDRFEPTSVVKLTKSFAAATGWKLNPRQASDPGASGLFELEANAERSRPKLSRSAASELASGISELVEELHQTRRNLIQREAELAAGIPVAARPDDEVHLAKRLETVLGTATRIVSGHAAALYMLNDDTSELKLRANWNLEPRHYLEPSRPLRGATADLESLLGHVVVIDDASKLPSWNVPLDYAAAVCVPVATPTTLLGTMWVFCEKPQDFPEAQTNMLEIIAGRIAADLEREAVLQQGVEAKTLDQSVEVAAEWQQRRLPNVEPLLDEWQVAGWHDPADAIGKSFYDWNIVADGRLAVALGEGQGRSMEASLVSAVLHSGLRAHASYPHDSARLLEQVNQTLWTSSSGNQFASLFYGLIDCEDGTFEYSSIGQGLALVVRRGTCEILTQARASLGLDPDPEVDCVFSGLLPAMPW